MFCSEGRLNSDEVVKFTADAAGGGEGGEGGRASRLSTGHTAWRSCSSAASRRGVLSLINRDSSGGTEA